MSPYLLKDCHVYLDILTFPVQHGNTGSTLDGWMGGLQGFDRFDG